MHVEEERECTEAAHDVLRRVGSIDAHDQELGPSLHDQPLLLEHFGIVVQLVELRRVYSDRMTRDERCAAVVRDRRGRDIHVCGKDLFAAVQEVPLPPLGVEADDVVGKQALVDVTPEMLRQYVPVVRLRPGDVDEVQGQCVRTSRTHELGREVQVVVVKEHRGSGLAIELGDGRVRERLVDGEVAAVPRGVQAEVQVRRVRQPPHVVLEEPERRIGDDVVVPVVRRGVERDQADAIGRAVASRLVGRLAAVLARDDAVLLAHRARDPRHLVPRHQAAQRGDEPAATPAHDPLARRRTLVRNGTAIRNDDELARIVHHAGTYPAHATSDRPRYVRSFTKRSREPRAPGFESISNSSATVRMIAIPRPPSESSLPS